MKTVNFFKYAVFALALGLFATACDDDDPVKDPTEQGDGNEGNEPGGSDPEEPVEPTTAKFVITSSEKALDLKSPAYLKVFTDLTQTTSDVQIVGGENVVTAPDAFTQVSWNSDSKTFTGYIYGRGAITLGGAGLRSYKLDGDKMVEIGSAVTVENFGNTGTFGNYSYAAQISNPYVMRVSRSDDNTAGDNRYIADFTDKYAIDGVMPAITEIIDRGNNEVAMTLYYSNSDKAAVAFADYDLNVSSVIYDERIGASYGAQRSVRYAQAATDDEGNIYVFSGQPSNDNLVGALKIAKGSKEFDKSYHFNIGEKSGGYRFRKVYHIGGDDFLLECFPETGAVENMSTSGKMAVVNMKSLSFKWVTGFPEDVNSISIGFPDNADGKIYVPVSGASSMHGGGSGGGKPSGKAASATVTPTIYVIGADGVATPGMTFKNTELLKAITILK